MKQGRPSCLAIRGCDIQNIRTGRRCCKSYLSMGSEDSKVTPKPIDNLDRKIQQNYSDAELQMLKEKIQMPVLYCPSRHQVANVCINSQCPSETALYCEESDACTFCLHQHEECESIKLSKLNSLIEKRTEEQREFITQVLNMEEKLIQGIRQGRRQFVEQYRWLSLPGEFQPILQQFSRTNKQNLAVKPAEASAIFFSLRGTREQSHKVLKEIEQETGKMVIKIQNLREKLVESLWVPSSSQPKQKTSLGFLQGSRIVETNQRQDIQLIFEALNKPRWLELLFRASEHNFSALKFHQLCDGVSHTLTLVKTSFGKTICGFTPLAWQSSTSPQHLADPSKSSFLLSLDLKQKMTLIQPGTAIYCRMDSGPVFGYGHDLFISDRCDIKDCITNFPTSYNYHGEHKPNEKSWQMFTGARRFNVLEYEVFKVVW